ncbi:hypothetical protein [Ulvibacterium sp.]|nr:hypothetical protein [Ulvibacterium sp.]
MFLRTMNTNFMNVAYGYWIKEGRGGKPYFIGMANDSFIYI